MIPSSLAPARTLSLLLLFAMLAACQSLPRPTGFTAQQVAALKAEGFVEGDPDWSLTFHDRLLFPFDESNLPPEQEDRIAAMARHLVAVGIDSARVEGHTDSVGTDAYNQSLSQERAETVARPMRAGGMHFAPDQVVGRGEALPVSDNATAEGRQDNRRVVIIVTP